MPISRLTAYIIATRDDIRVTAAYHKPSNKWAGWITLGEDDRYRPLLNSSPYYNTEEEAVAGMRKVIEEVTAAVKKEMDGRSAMESLMNPNPSDQREFHGRDG